MPGGRRRGCGRRRAGDGQPQQQQEARPPDDVVPRQIHGAETTPPTRRGLHPRMARVHVPLCQRNGSGRVAGRPMTTTRSRPLRTQQSTPAELGAARPAAASTAALPRRTGTGGDRHPPRDRHRADRAAARRRAPRRQAGGRRRPAGHGRHLRRRSRPAGRRAAAARGARQRRRGAAGGRRRCAWSTTIAGPAASGSTAMRGIATPSRPGATQFGSVRAALLKKVEAQVDLATELAEMRVLLEAALLRARDHGRAGVGDATLIERGAGRSCAAPAAMRAAPRPCPAKSCWPPCAAIRTVRRPPAPRSCR